MKHLEQVMLEKKNIHPNVDFPCGPTYYMMGIDIDFYTPIFVMSRITGWSAHIMEQHASNKLIRPLSKYKGEEVREVMLLKSKIDESYKFITFFNLSDLSYLYFYAMERH